MILWRSALAVLLLLLVAPASAQPTANLGQACTAGMTICQPESSVKCQQVSNVCKRTFEPCIDPNPCLVLANMTSDAAKKMLTRCEPDATNSRGFDCKGPSLAPTPFPTTVAPGAPTPVGTAPVMGDICKEEAALCQPSEIGSLKGCPCKNGLCSGTDAESGQVLGCNRASNRCAPCMPGSLFCACGAGCGQNLVCQEMQCMPAAGFTLPCPPGGVGCPCLATKCKTTLACSSQLSRCVACPRGCKESCAQAAVGRNDTCAGKSTSCNDCKALSECSWCGEAQGCRPGKCDDGSNGVAGCASCAGLSDCSGGGECIGPDMCRCNRGFVNDAMFGCISENFTPTEAPMGSGDIYIYAGAGGGAACLCLLVVVVFLVMRQKKKSKSTDYNTVMSPVAGDAGAGGANDAAAGALGMFNCNICGKSYNFQSDLETHTSMRHGDNGGTMSGNTLNGAPFGTQAVGFQPQAYGGDSQMMFNTAGDSFNGGGQAFGDPYAQQQQQQQYDNSGGSWNGGAAW